jgi:hypothetical protein
MVSRGWNDFVSHFVYSDGRPEHFPEKWAPVFRRKCEKIKKPERFPIQLNRKALWLAGCRPAASRPDKSAAAV